MYYMKALLYSFDVATIMSQSKQQPIRFRQTHKLDTSWEKMSSPSINTRIQLFMPAPTCIGWANDEHCMNSPIFIIREY